jgi:hypothetical protein
LVERDTAAVELDSPSRVLMGVGGWIIVFVGAWAAIRSNGLVIRASGGASWMSPAMRRFWGIVLVLFGACLVAGSIVL